MSTEVRGSAPAAPEDAPAAVSPRGRRWRRIVRLSGVLLAVAVALGLGWRMAFPHDQRAASGVSLGPLPRGVARDQLNVLVITLDTTRADRIGAYGARQVETPAVDRLAREGVLFEQTMTTAPLTLPAHVSIFTGRFPPEHAVRDNGGFFLDSREVTLAEQLKQTGFETGAVVAAFVLDSKWGLDQGFDTYIDDFDLTRVKGFSLGSVQRPGNEVVDKALAWLEPRVQKRFFSWIHLYDPHTPYEPPEPYRSRYAGHPYNGEIAFTDAQVGRVIGFLQQRAVLDRTIVVVVGDHGEGLGDHGEAAHGFFIYESSTRVPFIIRAPFEGLRRGRRVADPVRVVDMVPTLLDLLGQRPAEGVSGTSLVPLMTGAVRVVDLEGYAEAMYPLHHFGWSELRSLRAGRYKLIDAPRPELFDLEQDPDEHSNIFESRRTVGDAMLARLRERAHEFEQAVPGASQKIDVDPEVRGRLAALGYVGTFVATAATAGSGRADPKDKIAIFNQMTTARDASKEGEADPSGEVVRTLRSVLDADPDVIDAWFMLGNEFYKARQYERAVEHFRGALALKPDYDLAIINMANAYRAMGRDEAALAGYERYLTVDPRNAYVWYQVGEIYLDRGDIAKAERHFSQALVIDDKVAPARNALGVVAFKRGDLDGAEREIRAAIVLKSDVRLAHYNLALIAEAREDWATAAAEYRRELDLHPDSYRSAFNLSRIHERAGETSARIAALKQAIEANPYFAEGHFYLAKAYLDADTRLDEALRLARKGLELDRSSPVAPLGHFVAAGVLMKRGHVGEAGRELAAGRALEARVERMRR